jgi:hypothetical protein
MESAMKPTKWGLYIDDKLVYSSHQRDKLEKEGFNLAVKAFSEFIEEWRDRVQKEFDAQVEEYNAHVRANDHVVLTSWAFDKVNKFEQAGIKKVRVDETDRKDYRKQGSIITESGTVFMVPSKEAEGYHFFGKVIAIKEGQD